MYVSNEGIERNCKYLFRGAVGGRTPCAAVVHGTPLREN